MTLMTKRERVMRTVRFEETDRVPLYDQIHNDAIIEHYAGQPLTIEDGERITSLAIGRSLDMVRGVVGPSTPHIVRHENGMLLQVERWNCWTLEHPFRDMPGLVEYVKTQIRQAEGKVFDRAHGERFRRSVRDRLATFARADPTGRDDPAVLVVESGAGLTDIYWIAGAEWFAYLAADHPGLLEEWLEANNRAELRRVAAIADPDLVPIVLTYDDIAYKAGLLYSPDWLRKHWLPRLRRLNDAWHSRDTVCLFHSDGNLWQIMDDLVAAGIDGLNPLEVAAGMSVQEARRRYPKLFLAGGIDVSQLLVFGSPEEVRAACRRAIADTGGRGYFLGSSTELHWEVPLQNAIAMFESAWESGGDRQ